MDFNIFDEKEIKFVKKYIGKALLILVIVAVLSGFSNIINVYSRLGPSGIKSLVDQDNLAAASDVDPEIVQSVTKVNSADVIKPSELGIVTGELPLEIYVPSIDLRSHIEAPSVAKVDILDAALMKGPVYYPGSGTPGSGNVLLFGHSSSWTVVRNKNYKIFNKLKEAKKDEFVYVKTSSGTHIYKVVDVKKVSKYNTWVQFDQKKPTITLATCDSFGKRSDRWVLEAEYYKFEKF